MKSPYPYEESRNIARRLDFSEEEKILGRSLTDNEKYVAVQNVNELVSLLRAAYGKMLGCHVYIKREDPPPLKSKGRKGKNDPDPR
jgi:hypothetical protein